MWINEKCTISPYGEAQIRETIHEGRLFHLYRATLADTDVCLKVPNPSPGNCCAARFLGSETMVWSGSSGVLKVSAAELTLLLLLEAETVRSTRGLWNHQVLGIGAFDAFSPELLSATYFSLSHPHSDPNRFWPVVILPYHSANPLSKYPRAPKCDLFLSILPTLWDALCAQPHADLSESNILVDEQNQSFILIDPGVCMASHSVDTSDSYANHRILFTTNSANYPLLFPFFDHRGGERNLGEQTLQDMLGDLIDKPDYLLRPSHFSLFGGAAVKKRPSMADMQALGLMYYRMLTGMELLPTVDGALDEPLWCGRFGEAYLMKWIERHQRVRDVLSADFIRQKLAKIDREAATLIEQLVNLQITTKDQLEKCVLKLLPKRVPRSNGGNDQRPKH